MRFFEKLDFLMKITNTTNSTLSLHTSLDPSHISRLRRGQRNAARNDVYVKSMADYFSRHCSDHYQRKALFDVSQIAPDAYSSSELGEYIFQWLADDSKSEIQTIDRFLGRLTSNTSLKNLTETQISKDVILLQNPRKSVYFGSEGKRQAVICFLTDVLFQSKPGTLLLYSDEPTDWMTSDIEFAAKCSSLMLEALAKGYKIKIIHTVSRDLDEMLNAIGQWIPLYMTGMIEPFYYPKKRDGIFKRTLFIAPKISAVVSESVGVMNNQAANLLFNEKNVVSSFEQEFIQYLDLCRPLMRIFTIKNNDAYLDTLKEFEKEQGDSILITESLSLLTMPESVVSSIVSRINNKPLDFIKFQKERMSFLEKNISIKSFTEIICLPDAETVKNTKVKIAFSSMLASGSVYYTPQEFVLHLENIVSLLKMYKNFHVSLISSTHYNCMIYAREDLGVIVSKTSDPFVVFAINEDNMTAAFWDFLRNMVGEKVYSNPNNNNSINLLTKYIQQLKLKF